MRNVSAVECVVGPMTKGQEEGARVVLARAFAEDPVLTFFLHEPRRRQLAYRVFFADVIHAHRRFGHLYSALSEGKVVGAAVWQPPDAGPYSLAERLHTLAGQWLLRLLFPGTAAGLFEGFAATRELHPAEPHWYLVFAGVDPSVQGQGIGERLLAPVLESADQTGTLCYLETPFPRTHAFYRRLGFEVTGEAHPFVGAPPVWTLVRSPHPH